MVRRRASAQWILKISPSRSINALTRDAFPILRRVYALGAHGIFKQEIRDGFELHGAHLPEWVPSMPSVGAIQSRTATSVAFREFGSRALASTWFRNQRPEHLP